MKQDMGDLPALAEAEPCCTVSAIRRVSGLWEIVMRVGDKFTLQGFYRVERKWWQFGKPRWASQKWLFWRPIKTRVMQDFSIVASFSSSDTAQHHPSLNRS